MNQPKITNCPKCEGTGLHKRKKCDLCGGDGWVELEEATEELRCLWSKQDLGILTDEEYQRLTELGY
ncbi:hypothetical protein I8752_02720 [Nostocaceae cyanobacterium CENA369]|uniref:Uncharacterized protein n=1 Tax=Dendronalium phyllosphericum CENA369 TaxID=1725256 RepID=A0A8J7I3V5_9NOST|nr:hypothetical protein [Dendronalium phyllosphericum]MBH8571962.1 hypothetical protein [Dendronalium phyllosphericum CENA369]